MSTTLSNEDLESIKKLAESARNVSAELDPQAIATRNATARSKELNESFKTLSKDIGTSAVSFSKNLVSAGEGMGKFGDSLTGATNAIGNTAQTLLKGFPILGLVVGGLIKIFGELGAASLKQNDNLQKAYDDLSQIGSIGKDGIEGLLSDLNRVGLTSEEFEKFNSQLKRVGPELANLGGSFTEGRKKYTDLLGTMIGPGNQVEVALRRIGVSTEQIREGAANYIDLQTRMGTGQGKTTEQLRKESVKYIEAMKDLQELTGASADKLREVQAQQQADYRYNKYLRDLEMQGAEGQAKANRYRDAMTAVQLELGVEYANGLKTQLVNFGSVVDESSAMVNTATKGQAHQLLIAVGENKLSINSMLSQTGTILQETAKTHAGTMNLSMDAAKMVAGTAEMQNGALRNAGKTEQDIAEQRKKRQADETGRLNTNIKQEQEARQLRIGYDKMLFETGNLVIPAMSGLTSMTLQLAKAMEQFYNWIASTSIGRKLGLEKTTFFRDLSDVKKEIDNTLKEKEQLEKEVVAAKQELVRAENEKNMIDQMIAIKEASQAILKKSIEDHEAQLKITKNRKEKEDLQKTIDKEKELFSNERFQLQKDKAKFDRLQNEINTKINTDEKKRQIQQKEEDLINKKKKLLELEQENILKGGEADITLGSGSGQVDNKKLLDFIGKAEGANYNTLVGGSTKDLENMTVEQVQALQKEMSSSKNYLSNAVGKYQIIADTLNEAMKATGVKSTDKFNAATQDKLANYLLEKRGVNEFNSGKISLEQFIDSLAKEWASLPTRSGKSYYDGDGTNKSTVKRSEVRKAVLPSQVVPMGTDVTNANPSTPETMPGAAKGARFSGPKSGYPVILHGKNESVWPEQKIKSLLAEVQASSIDQYKKELISEMGLQKSSFGTPVTSVNNDMMVAMMDKLDQFINNQNTANNTLTELLTYTKA